MIILAFVLGTVFWLAYYLFFLALKSAHPDLWEEYKPSDLLPSSTTWNIFLISARHVGPRLGAVLWFLRALAGALIAIAVILISRHE